MKSLHIHPSLALIIFIFSSFSPTLSSSLASTTGECKPWKWDANGNFIVDTAPQSTPRPIQPGEINCRYWAKTKGEVDCRTCAQLTSFYGVDAGKFLMLNPNLKRDCSNIAPNSKYCVAGSLRAWDGRCGPPHNNATCVGMDMGQCCNSETWTCGNTEEDCAPGTCYEGTCPGHRVYTTDGKCGRDQGNRLCAGKWGDCCNMDGDCGTGEDFCDEGRCHFATSTSTTDENIVITAGEL
ncbi:hypothetical protein F4819DRAFT_498603 [Hypoxylon fuscum]|nr:hypothetical protein F4819DRAFT_498603 [Hypoxylon fuscum]